ncbi:MAG: 3-methyl-2-oxobutanoate hydroxymethyltransferase [Armatimonadetes bacterium]|nr:3-methyl-2-oxobutanoate hydroxymethyltransferase [Armatimonadota bacterium]
MPSKITAPMLREMKRKGEKISMITAYDAAFARLADEAGVDAILVGDSLGNVMLGYHTTLPVSMEAMVHHTRAVASSPRRALIISDMPFGSYQASPEDAVRAAVELVKAGAEVVKLEGPYHEAIRAITRAGIPVFGHVGMTPQSVNLFGGHKVQGRNGRGQPVIEAAKTVDEAGAIGMVLELVPRALACEITRSVGCATIGIGAGPECDGQVLVMHDMLGLGEGDFKHSKFYAKLGEQVVAAFKQYSDEVKSGAFPDAEHSFEDRP